MHLLADTSLWLIFPALLFGAVVTFILYFKKSSTLFSKPTSILLALLRFISSSLIALLLIGLFFEHTTNRTEKPILLFAFDVSRSVEQKGADTLYQSLFQLAENLSNKYRTEFLTFGREVSEISEKPIHFQENYTDFSLLSERIEQRYDQSESGAIVLASDGIATTGAALPYALQQINWPIYTLPMGDTSRSKDLSINEIKHNSTAYKGNQFPVIVYLNSTADIGQKLTVTLWDHNSEIDKKEVSTTSSPAALQVNFSPTATTIGLHNYRVTVSPLENEANRFNNSAQFYVNIREAKQKILIAADAPHPDIGAIRAALEPHTDFEVTLTFKPIEIENLETYNLVILSQLPSTSAAHRGWLQKVKNMKIPLLFLIGERTDLTNFNAIQSAVEIIQNGAMREQVLATYNRSFSLFETDEATIEMALQSPPLNVPFANFKSANSTSPLLYQRVGNIESEKPLIAFFRNNKIRYGYFFGEGLWRWRLNDYRRNGTHLAFDNLIVKTVQLLTYHHNEGPFRVTTNPLVEAGEKLIFNGELYNSNGEIVNHSEVDLRLTDSIGDELHYTFLPFRERYKLEIDGFPSGRYKWSATTALADQKFKQSGIINIRSIDVELHATQPDISALQKTANQTGGKQFLPDNLNQLEQLLSENEAMKPTVYQEKNYHSPTDFLLLLLVIILFLTAEWLIRKRAGGI